MHGIADLIRSHIGVRTLERRVPSWPAVGYGWPVAFGARTGVEARVHLVWGLQCIKLSVHFRHGVVAPYVVAAQEVACS